MKSRLLIVGLLHILGNYTIVTADSDIFIPYIVQPQNYRGIAVLKAIEKLGECIVWRHPAKPNVTVDIMISIDFKNEIEEVMKYNYIRYNALKSRDMTDLCEYVVQPKTLRAVHYLESIPRYGYRIIPRSFTINDEITITIHPQFRKHFETKLNRVKIEYEVRPFHIKDFTQRLNQLFNNSGIRYYEVISHDIRGLRLLKKMIRRSFCNSSTIPTRVHKSLVIEVPNEIADSIEILMESFRVTWTRQFTSFTKPDLHHFCDYSVIPKDAVALTFLRKLVKEGRGIFRVKPTGLNKPSIISIHTESMKMLENTFRTYDIEYKMINSMPKKPNYNNFYAYELTPQNNKVFRALKMFAKTTSFMVWTIPNDAKHPVNITIHPEHKKEFEQMLKKLSIDYKLTNYMPKEVDCSNFCAYAVRLESPTAFQTFKDYLIKIDCIYWKNYQGLNKQIDVMIHRKFMREFEELLKTNNIQYELLMDELGRDNSDAP